MLGKVDDEEKKLIELSTLNNAYGRKLNLTSNTWFLTEDEKVKVNNGYSESRTGGNGTWFLTQEEKGIYNVYTLGNMKS